MNLAELRTRVSPEEPEEPEPTSRRTTLVKGALVFVVLVAALWWVRSSGEEDTDSE